MKILALVVRYEPEDVEKGTDGGVEKSAGACRFGEQRSGGAAVKEGEEEGGGDEKRGEEGEEPEKVRREEDYVAEVEWVGEDKVAEHVALSDQKGPEASGLPGAVWQRQFCHFPLCVRARARVCVRERE